MHPPLNKNTRFGLKFLRFSHTYPQVSGGGGLEGESRIGTGGLRESQKTFLPLYPLEGRPHCEGPVCLPHIPTSLISSPHPLPFCSFFSTKSHSFSLSVESVTLFSKNYIYLVSLCLKKPPILEVKFPRLFLWLVIFAVWGFCHVSLSLTSPPLSYGDRGWQLRSLCSCSHTWRGIEKSWGSFATFYSWTLPAVILNPRNL